MDIIFDIKDIDQMLDWFEADIAKTIVLQNSENLFHQSRYKSYKQQVMYYVYCFAEVSTWRRRIGQEVSKTVEYFNR